MYTLQCLNLEGDTVNHFTQYDVNQKIIISGFELPFVPPVVEFCNMHSDNTIAMQSQVIDDNPQSVLVDVPNILLKSDSNIVGYVYLSDYNDLSSKKTVAVLKIPVRGKEKIGNYDYENNVPEIETLITQSIQESKKNSEDIIFIKNNYVKNLEYSSPYNFKGSCVYANLPKTNNIINDTWYATDKRQRYTWNGSGWYPSSMPESDYLDELAKVKTVAVSEDEIVNPSVELLIHPHAKENFFVPEIDDENESSYDTWSSKKIKEEIDKIDVATIDEVKEFLGA